MSRVFVIADLHLGHRKVAGLRGFGDTESHDAALVEAWNRTVTKRDVVYVLGDVFRTHLIPSLLGTKKLAMGNHDKGPVELYRGAGFTKVAAMFEFDGCLLTHIPVHPSQFSRYEMNVHGHTHDTHLVDERYVPVSVEHCTRFEPLPLCALIEARRKRNALPRCPICKTLPSEVTCTNCGLDVCPACSTKYVCDLCWVPPGVEP